jgi:hypothetical protein
VDEVLKPAFFSLENFMYPDYAEYEDLTDCMERFKDRSTGKVLGWSKYFNTKGVAEWKE